MLKENKNYNLLELLEKLETAKTEEKQTIIRGLKEAKWTFDVREYNLIQSNLSLIALSMRNDFATTIEELSKLSITDSLNFNAKTKNAIKQMLKENNFKLDKENMGLVCNSNLFLLASLDNDFEGTMEILKNNFPFAINLDDESEQEIYDILLRHNFKYDDNTPKCIYYNKGVLKAALDNSYIDVVKSIKYDENLGEDVKDMIFNILKDEEPPQNYWPLKMLEDPYILDKLVGEKEKEFILNKIVDRNYVCSRDDEIELLRLLKSNAKSIEDHLVLLNKRGLERYTISLLDMYSLGFYIKKQLALENINGYKTNLFPTSEFSSDVLGSVKEREIFLSSNLTCDEDSIFSMIYVLNHEINHVLQQKYIDGGLFNKDSDIDLYQKDMILNILCDDYYEQNYERVSYEYDAENRAYITTYDLFSYNKDSTNSKESRSDDLNNYIYTNMRKCGEKEYLLEDLLEEKLQEYLSDKEEFNYRISKIRGIYPLFTYEYKTMNQELKRNTFEELVDMYDKTNDDVYGYLIEQSLISFKNKNALRNQEILKEYLDNHKYARLEEFFNESLNSAKSINDNEKFKYELLKNKVRKVR